MTIYALGDHIGFPDPLLANEDGLLAVGGDLKPARLVNAYAHGIFPWYSKGEPVLWWSPDPRWVLLPADLNISSTMRSILRKGKFTITFDKAFETVITHCAKAVRKGQKGTWITREMKSAYMQLHELHIAHSVEVWEAGALVGGLYGVSLGRIFYGESMFTEVSNASKAGFITLVKGLERLGFPLIDCQSHTPHLESLGAHPMRRADFLKVLEQELQYETLQMPWSEIPELQLPPC